MYRFVCLLAFALAATLSPAAAQPATNGLPARV